LQYASASSDNLTLASTGSGDIAEMTGTLADDEAAYAYVRMKLGNDEYSERVKFVFVVWAGMSSLLLLLLFFSLPLSSSSPFMFPYSFFSNQVTNGMASFVIFFSPFLFFSNRVS
jgi:hypothetical protein